MDSDNSRQGVVCVFPPLRAVQYDDPGTGNESNWLPAPSGPFYLTLRVYAPKRSLAKALAASTKFEAPPSIVPAYQ